MADQSYAESKWPEDRTSTRIRAFLARTKPLEGCDMGSCPIFWDGRQLIEALALGYETEQDVHWSPRECADVLRYLHSVEPIKDSCFCNDRSMINATCGFHAILEFMEEQLRAMPKQRMTRKRPEVIHDGR